MGKDKQTPITIDNVEYFFENMTEQQKVIVNHLSDLDRKIASAEFNLDQLKVGKQAFVEMLKKALAEPAE